MELNVICMMHATKSILLHNADVSKVYKGLALYRPTMWTNNICRTNILHNIVVLCTIIRYVDYRKIMKLEKMLGFFFAKSTEFYST